MVAADLLFGAGVVLVLLVFPGSEATPVGALWLFRGLLVLHVAAYCVTRRWCPNPSGAPLLTTPVCEPSERHSRMLLAVLLLLALTLRLPFLNQGLWFDEIDTLVTYAREPFARITTTFHSRNQHMLYSLAAHASFLAFGESAWALRLPAVLFGVVSLWALYELGCLLTRRAEARLAVGLLVVSYQHVWFSQNARGYTGLLLWATLGSALFLRLLRGATFGARTAWTYGAVMALGVLTHVTAAFMILSHFLLWGFSAWHARHTASRAAILVPLFGLVLAGTLSALFYAQVFQQARGVVAPSRPLLTKADVTAMGSSQQPVLSEPPSYRADSSTGVDRMLRRLRWLAEELRQRLAIFPTHAWITLAVAFVVLLVGLFSYARQDWRIATLLLLPGGVTFGLLFLSDQVLFPRFFFFALGFAALLFVRGLYQLPLLLGLSHPQRLTHLIAAGLLVASASTLPQAWGPKEDYAAARAYLHQHAGSEDAIVTVGMSRLPFVVYYKEPWLVVKSASELADIAASHATTWVVYTHAVHLRSAHADVWSALGESYTPVAVFPGSVGDGDIVVTVRRRNDA